ncbi:hypothetical protein L2E82_02378 [Cichorium intybus]|uniref:Uncharacterized protein n=1 Tax=Cichorium intybus TaxID=13427 RepID=A0ACB9H149_CICIN|nr:hypothetical protein L1887_03863 [Cichorium endivia]KAI3789578.1 hypothetical protein L2E82_02378 [Cichorium intybus]
MGRWKKCWCDGIDFSNCLKWEYDGLIMILVEETFAITTAVITFAITAVPPTTATLSSPMTITTPASPITTADEVEVFCKDDSCRRNFGPLSFCLRNNGRNLDRESRFKIAIGTAKRDCLCT